MSSRAVCNWCGGKGWRWTGEYREGCLECNGTGRTQPPDQRRRGKPWRAADPVKSRVR